MLICVWWKSYCKINLKLCLTKTRSEYGPTFYTRQPCGLKHTSEAARLEGLRVRITLKSWMFVSCVCVKRWPLQRDDHSFRGVLPVVRACLRAREGVCDLETSTMRLSKPDLSSCVTENLPLMFQGQASLNSLKHNHYVINTYKFGFYPTESSESPVEG